MPYRQKVELLKAIAALPSLSVIVFLRKRIGFRLLDSGWYLAVAFVVYLIAIFNYDPSYPYPHAMEWYALGIVLFGAFHRGQAWFQFKKGTPPHSYSSGISIFLNRRTPQFIRRNRLANVVFDPLVTILTGAAVRIALSPIFGNWLMFAGVSLFLYELFIHANSINRDMDIADGLIAADIQSDSAKRFKGTTSAGSSENDGGAAIPTGLGSDIQARIKHRKASQTPPPTR
jgi:hypothetical protein